MFKCVLESRAMHYLMADAMALVNTPVKAPLEARTSYAHQ